MSIGKLQPDFHKTRLLSEKTRISRSSTGFLTVFTKLHQDTLLALNHLKREAEEDSNNRITEVFLDVMVNNKMFPHVNILYLI